MADSMQIARVSALILGAFVLAGCNRLQPVYNVPDTAVYVSGDDGAQEIREAIFAGAMAKGWRLEEAGPGHIVGRVDVRSHTAVVDIYYDADSYSIKYRDSTNLKYDGAMIHRNYNKWVILLDEQIRLNLPVR